MRVTLDGVSLSDQAELYRRGLSQESSRDTDLLGARCQASLETSPLGSPQEVNDVMADNGSGQAASSAARAASTPTSSRSRLLFELFWFDIEGRLRRHDGEVIGGLAFTILGINVIHVGWRCPGPGAFRQPRRGALTTRAPGFTIHASHGERQDLQPFEPNFISAVSAETIGAVVDARQCFVDQAQPALGPIDEIGMGIDRSRGAGHIHLVTRGRFFLFALILPVSGNSFVGFVPQTAQDCLQVIPPLVISHLC